MKSSIVLIVLPSVFLPSVLFPLSSKFPHPLFKYFLCLSSYLLSLSSLLALPYFPLSVRMGLPSPFLFGNHTFVFTLFFSPCLFVPFALCMHCTLFCNTLPSLINSLYSLDLPLFLSRILPTLFFVASVATGWAELWNGPSHQASPVENHLWWSEGKMCCGPHLS